MRKILYLSVVLAAGAASAAVLRVGPGEEYKTVQSAIDAVPSGNAGETIVEIASGDYEEHVLVPRDKPFVTMRAKDPGKVRIRSGESVYTVKDKQLPRCTALSVEANDFTAEGIVFDNYASRANVEAGGRGVGQALAVAVTSDRVTFRKCTFLGHQDTLLADGPHHGDGVSRQYYEDCEIEGTVDFIFGGAAAVFNRCRLRFADRGYVTAASTREGQRFGFVFVDCTLSGKDGMKKSELGRPWRPYAQTVFIGCRFDDVLKPEGWSNWRKPENEKTAWYGEFGCTGPGAESAARPAWIHTGTLAAADDYFTARGASSWRDVLAGSDGWRPFYFGGGLQNVAK